VYAGANKYHVDGFCLHQIVQVALSVSQYLTFLLNENMEPP